MASKAKRAFALQQPTPLGVPDTRDEDCLRRLQQAGFVNVEALNVLRRSALLAVAIAGDPQVTRLEWVFGF